MAGLVEELEGASGRERFAEIRDELRLVGVRVTEGDCDLLELPEHCLAVLFGGVAVQSGMEGGTQSEHGGDGEQDIESDDFPEKFGAQPGQAGAFCVGWAEPFGLAGRGG